jgi:glutathione synthase/RimK-type ligase-like ATP-grasp enzyme
MKRIGILFGKENAFPPALVERINGIATGVRADFVKTGTTDSNVPSGYDLIIDRISHNIPYYRACLKQAVLHGTMVINNPFWWSADDKFFGFALASRLGVAVPKTVLLPSKQHPPDTTSMSMRNLVYPLDWNEVFRTVGFPAYLKPDSGGGWKRVFMVSSEPEFFDAYNRTGDTVMMLQEAVEFDAYVRCYCIGGEEVRIMRYDPRGPQGDRYRRNTAPLEPVLEKRITRDCRTLNRALGYDINMVEFAIRDGVPCAIDFLNPAPEADVDAVGRENFEWLLNAVAELAVRRATAGERARREYRWAEFLRGSEMKRARKRKPPPRRKARR